LQLLYTGYLFETLEHRVLLKLGAGDFLDLEEAKLEVAVLEL
jgi:hypothetical protein